MDGVEQQSRPVAEDYHRKEGTDEDGAEIGAKGEVDSKLASKVSLTRAQASAAAQATQARADLEAMQANLEQDEAQVRVAEADRTIRPDAHAD